MHEKTVIHDMKHFKEALNLARKIGGDTKESFFHCLKSLNNIRRNLNGTLFLGKDFVQNSFVFTIRNGESLVLSGGMILHGFEETFSVELNAPAFPHWSLHT